ncbi:MAG: MBL fold metallo-hydrolase [Clostridiales bacterium]|nr:MBL fold metallo-hydrolase [Clostridiales bacterium]
MLTPIKYGNTNTYLVHGTTGNLLVDTDMAGTLQGFYRAIMAQEIQVSDITYVLATHYHPDHIGIVSELMALGVKLVIAQPQVEHVHYADEIFARTPQLNYKPIDESQARIITLEDSRAFLNELGIEGEIISTPSHSADSITLILDEGISITGDLEPQSYIDAYTDNKALKADWEKILSFHPHRICHAHANEVLL